MLRPFPLDNFCGGFSEVKSVILIVIAITLNPHEVDFHWSATADGGRDRIKGVGRATGSVNRIGH